MTSATAVQVGTAVVTRQDKRLAVGRLGALVEQIEALVSKDLQVILVSSIAVLRPILPSPSGCKFLTGTAAMESAASLHLRCCPI